MKYFIKSQAIAVTIGPYSIEEIEARLKAGELSADALTAADLGERPEKVKGWICVHQIPGLGGNPPMPSLEAAKSPTGSSDSQRASGLGSAGYDLCKKCSARALPGETLCRKCAEQTQPANKRSTAPHPLIVLFIQVPGGFLIHLVSFIFFCAMSGGGFRSHSALLIPVAVIHTLAWLAFAFRQIRDPASQGVGVGIFVGVFLTGMLTGSCALSK